MRAAKEPLGTCKREKKIVVYPETELQTLKNGWATVQLQVRSKQLPRVPSVSLTYISSCTDTITTR
jgi:hypothetical protein